MVPKELARSPLAFARELGHLDEIRLIVSNFQQDSEGAE